jgi:hypothetical protein
MYQTHIALAHSTTTSIDTQQICNSLGRFATGFIKIRQVTLLNVICTAFFGYELAMGLFSYPAPCPQWILVPVTGLYAFLNGYVSTIVYIVADDNAVAEFGDEALGPSRTIRRWVTLLNQGGSIAGSFLCASFAGTGLLKVKLPLCAAVIGTTTLAPHLLTTAAPNVDHVTAMQYAALYMSLL